MTMHLVLHKPGNGAHNARQTVELPDHQLAAKHPYRRRSECPEAVPVTVDTKLDRQTADIVERQLWVVMTR
jgi:hypothetical protein